MELEEQLNSQGFLLNLNANDGEFSLRDAEFRQLLKSTLCVKVTGRAVIEDYERIKGIAKAFPEVTKFINKSIEAGIKESPQYTSIKAQLDDIAAKLKDEKDRNKKAAAETNLRLLKSQLGSV